MNSAANNLFSLMGMDGDWSFPVIAGGLIFIRFVATINMTPFLGTKVVAGNIKVATAIALTLFVYPIVVPGMEKPQIPQQFSFLFVLFLKEALFGMLLGTVNTMIFYGIQSAGSMVDNQRYVANARIFNPALGAQTSIFGVFFYQLCIAIFIVIGGHRYFLKALVESFQVVPVFSLPKIMVPTITTGAVTNAVPMLELFMKLSAQTLIICLQLSAPVLIAIFVADLVLGITNRIAPMINVFEMGFNIKGFVGVLLVYLSIPLFINQSKYWFQVLISYYSRIIDYFR
ncbi:MAG: flagellar biosynthetic protein FliR [Terriglobia bacterium]